MNKARFRDLSAVPAKSLPYPLLLVVAAYLALTAPAALSDLSVESADLNITVADRSGEGGEGGEADQRIEKPEVALLIANSAGERLSVAASEGDRTRLYAVASDKNDTRKRVLLGYSFIEGVWKTEFQQPLEPTVQLLQLTRHHENPAKSTLLGYRDGSVVTLDRSSRSFESLLSVPSIYRTEAAEFAQEVTLGRDLNGDGRIDVLIPNFQGWQLATQKADGQFNAAQQFGPSPVMGMGSKRYVYFTAFEPYVFDHNRDGVADIAFWKDDALRVHYLDAEGNVDRDPVLFGPGIDIESDAFFSLAIGEDEDNPSGRQAILDDIEDLNGDSLPDLLVYSVTGDGLFGKETSYEIYLGKIGLGGTLEFETEPSSAVGSGGIQVDVDRQDLDGDGKLEMIITSFDLGIRSIIRGLLSRSANLDLAIYRLEEGRYPAVPNVKRRITAKLDLANGDVFVPAVVAGDVDGDGLKDLLIQDGEDELKVFAGTGTKSLFAKNAVTLDIDLPVAGGAVEVLDIDADGDDDLLLLFAGDSSADTPPKIVAVRFSGEL